VHIDKEVELNAALAHGILFGCWVDCVRDEDKHRRRCTDNHRSSGLSQHTRWRVMTGAMARTVCSVSLEASRGVKGRTQFPWWTSLST
jgi:hypothetical protein